MRPIVYFTVGFAPVIAAVIYFYFYKQTSKSFTSLLIKSFFLGMAGIVVLFAAQYLSSLLGLNDLRSLKRTLFYSFVTVGFGSELGMFLIYRYLIVPKEGMDTPLHGITLSIMVALGFSTIRILLFILDPLSTRDLMPVTLYSLVFVPANLIFAVIMGFYVGMAKFIKSRFVYDLTGLFAAAFFHGLFNFCLLSKDYKLLSLFAFGSMVIVFILGMKAASTKPEPLDKI